MRLLLIAEQPPDMPPDKEERSTDEESKLQHCVERGLAGVLL